MTKGFRKYVSLALLVFLQTSLGLVLLRAGPHATGNNTFEAVILVGSLAGQVSGKRKGWSGYASAQEQLKGREIK